MTNKSREENIEKIERRIFKGCAELDGPECRELAEHLYDNNVRHISGFEIYEEPITGDGTVHYVHKIRAKEEKI